MHENWFVLVTDLEQTRLPQSLFSDLSAYLHNWRQLYWYRQVFSKFGRRWRTYML